MRRNKNLVKLEVIYGKNNHMQIFSYDYGDNLKCETVGYFIGLLLIILCILFQ